MAAPLAVGGSRLLWDEIPVEVRAAVETAAGAPVVGATSQSGGFSPGLASVLRLAGGRSVFVKAVNAARNPHSPGMYRTEIKVLSGLPASVPAPRLLWSYDDGDWVVMMIEAVAGTSPAQPWREPELATYLELAARLAVELTPAPLPAPTVQDSLRDLFTGWRALAAGGPAAPGSPAPGSAAPGSAAPGPSTADGPARFGTRPRAEPAPPDLADRLDPWTRKHLDRLAGIEAGWEPAAAGVTLLHGDLRADNVLLAPTGAVAVDWPHVSVAAPWVDLLFALPSIAMHGGGDPQRLWDRFPPARRTDPDAVSAVLAAATGFFLVQGHRPDPPNLPRVRAFQRAQARAGIAWLRTRLGE